MTVDAYRAALEAAVREYEALGEQRQAIDRRLAELAQSISTMTRLCGLTPTVPWGLTDACRVVLRGAGVPMTPMEVRDRLLAIGFDLSKYSNDLAAIHTTLKRLNEAGEVRFLTRGARKHAYVWVRPVRAFAMGPDVAAFMGGAASEPVPASPRRSRRAK